MTDLAYTSALLRELEQLRARVVEQDRELDRQRSLTRTVVEAWPVAADELGIYLVSGHDAWRTGPISTTAHTAVTQLLRDNGELTGAALLHSPSWRDVEDDGTIVLTYVAVCGTHGQAPMHADNVLGEYEFVREIWPEALPFSIEVAEDAGLAPWHGATEQPQPRRIDVLRHAVRHLAWLEQTDATNRAALDRHWRAHLAGVRPALAGMYEHAL